MVLAVVFVLESKALYYSRGIRPTFLVQNLFRMVSSFCLHHRHSTLVLGA